MDIILKIIVFASGGTKSNKRTTSTGKAAFFYWLFK